MKIAQAEKEILSALLANPVRVLVLDEAPTGQPFVVVDGTHGYVIPEDALWLDLGRIEKHCNYSSVVKFEPRAQLLIEKTNELLEIRGLLCRKFVTSHGDVYVPEAQLKYFVFPTFYQERINGPVLVTEETIELECLVGLVMPVRLEDDEL